MKKKCIAALVLVCLFQEIAALAQNTAAIPVPRTFPTNWMARHEAFVAEAKRGSIDLLFIGDSITDGWHWAKGGQNVWNKYYASRHAADFGIGYDRTQNVLWRIEHGELDGIKPKAVVLLIGTNNTGNEDDGKPRNSTPEVIAGVTAIVHELRTRLPESKILLLGIFPRGQQKDDSIRLQIGEINSQLAKLDDGRMIQFLDITSKLLSADGTLSRDIMPDLLHPNERGYEIWAEAMEGPLAAMLK
jgi:lysophospholipase L1-like esterase